MSPHRHPRDAHRVPMFFKLWFVFIAILSLATMGLMVWAGASLVTAGPDAIGRAAGQAVRAYHDAAQ